jgi:hypothetical protein
MRHGFTFGPGRRKILLFLALALASLSLACTSKSADVKSVIEEQLKNQGIREVNVDYFYEDPSAADRAYASATVTYNFARSDGQLQKEYLGYILKKEGGGWTIQQTTSYTKDQQRAQQLLSGNKPGAS